MDLNGVPIPESIIKANAAASGASTAYRDIGYLRLQVILPWPAWLFASISAVILFQASRKRSRSAFQGETTPSVTSEEGDSTFSDKYVEEKVVPC
ncbi:hypothetical protein FA95DRAFT_1222466 [Auriscalpium vulgare]|uniref:Uncharacterized protein n=1 Tax=Auriscalpium vulgare TaxID=40419 RepID=A0ACB8RU68_9AGAM|nr:hypothetical protein FA95DRAFT_1222466 [Auriscalpium vulgare]